MRELCRPVNNLLDRFLQKTGFLSCQIIVLAARLPRSLVATFLRGKEADLGEHLQLYSIFLRRRLALGRRFSCNASQFSLP